MSSHDDGEQRARGKFYEFIVRIVVKSDSYAQAKRDVLPAVQYLDAPGVYIARIENSRLLPDEEVPNG